MSALERLQPATNLNTGFFWCFKKTTTKKLNNHRCMNLMY